MTRSLKTTAAPRGFASDGVKRKPITPEPRLRAFRIIDGILIAALILAAAVSFPLLASSRGGTVQVFRVDRLVAEYPLNEDRRFKVNGDLGPVGIEIKAGKARICDATCPNGLCVHAGAIDQPHRMVLCAPNRVMITVSAENREDRVDAVSQ